MLIKYEMPLDLGPGDFTAEGRVKMSTLLRAFQDAAGNHAEREGLGFEALLSQNYIWVVMKIKVRLLREPRPGEDCRLVTYPRQTTSRIFNRDFYILDSDGNELVLATSEWCVLNFTTRRVEQTELRFKGEYTQRLAIPEGIERVRPKELSFVKKHIVTAEDLDGNQHTNNCRYADMAMDVLGLETAGEFTINFARETRLGDEIELYRGEDGIAAGKCGGALVFAAKIK